MFQRTSSFHASRRKIHRSTMKTGQNSLSQNSVLSKFFEQKTHACQKTKQFP